MIPHFCVNVKFFDTTRPYARLHPLPKGRGLDGKIDNEEESVWIEIGLVDNVSIRILCGSTFVYEGAVHDSRPVYFVTFLIGSDVIAIRTLASRQLL